MPDATNAKRGLVPKIWKGRVHQVIRRTSISQRHAPSTRQARPAVNTVYELVQMFLLIGKNQPQNEPAAAPNAPNANSPAMRSSNGRDEPIQRPAKVPSIAVTIAGSVESGPSGSHVFVCAQRWPSRSRRSTYAARVDSGLSRTPGP